jgi:regulator of protease activity HflC (stomatin/prohibitin superfamily)
MNMKNRRFPLKSYPFTLTILFLLFFQLSSCVTVQPGYRGIRVYLSDEKDKSGDIEVLGVGRYLIISFSKRVYTFPVFQQNFVWSNANEEGDRSISFQTIEGLSVNGDFGISYSIIPDSVATIFQRYRRGIDEITDIFLRNMVRDALNSEASQMTMEDVYGKSRQELLKKVEASVAKQVKSVGIVIDRIYSVGEFRLPQPSSTECIDLP